MTTNRTYTMIELVEEALDSTGSAKTVEVRRWMQLNRRVSLDEHFCLIEAEGLDAMIRRYRKSRDRTPEEEADGFSLCFDFGLEQIELPSEISVPVDMNNVAYGSCDWPLLEEATLDDLDKHMVLLHVQQIQLGVSRENILRLRQAAASIVPGRTDIPLRVLREIARGERQSP